MKDTSFPALVVSRKTGSESFRAANRPLGFDLLSFWQWSASDLVSNALRGRLAEFLVARALGIDSGVRAEWDAYDLRTPAGTTIEVKSAAYFQTWHQKTRSTICFDIAPTRFWSSATNASAKEVKRQADLYVFALLAHLEKATLDPMDVSQWKFYVLRKSVLDARLPAQKQLSLSVLLKLEPVQCAFEGLPAAVRAASVEGSLHAPPVQRSQPAL